MNNLKQEYISVEIGGTKQQIALGTSDGTILEHYQIKLSDDTTAENILKWIKATIQNILAQNHSVSGIGVGFGGPIDAVTGKIVCSLQVKGWDQFPLQEWFSTTFDLPTRVLNDTVTGGFAELYAGAGTDCSRMLYTNIGTGIGGGLYIGGFFCPASIGYLWVPDWTASFPGTKTRLEFICSGPSIEKRLNSDGYVPADSFLTKLNRPYTCLHLSEGISRNDPFCLSELDRIAETFSIGLADTLALVCPEKIIIGGGVAKIGESLFTRLRAHTEKMAFVADIGKYKILPSALADDAVLIGGLFLASNQYTLSNNKYS